MSRRIVPLAVLLASWTFPVGTSYPGAREPASPSENGTPSQAIAPFDGREARARQAAWAEFLDTRIESRNSLGTTMVLVPPGEFAMGSTDAQVERVLELADEFELDERSQMRIRDHERPQHRMVIAEPFLLAATEVTIAEFQKFVEATGYRTQAEELGSGNSAATEKATGDDRNGFDWRSPGFAQTGNAAVSQVSWNDAVAFCNWLSEREDRPTSYRLDDEHGWRRIPGATGYRLPTEAEWEYAARAGTTTQYHFGDDVRKLGDYDWFGSKSGSNPKRVVGAKRRNPFGLYDIHGNVGEWCEDFYDPTSYPRHYVTRPPKSQTVPRRVVRGGDWWCNPLRCRSAFRGYGDQVTRSDDLGFRVARSAK